MNRPTRASDSAPALGALVVLAIGLRLMLSGATVAASACTDSLERAGVRRFSETVVQALREISERAGVSARTPPTEREWTPAPTRSAATAPVLATGVTPLSPWVTTLPPPATA